MANCRFVFVTSEAPFIGLRESCSSQFRSYRPDKKEAEQIIKVQLDAHDCETEDR
jgi:hypothetical protein